MDPELQDVLARIGTDNPPTNDELAAARTALVEAASEALTDDGSGKIDLDSARTLRDAVGVVEGEQNARSEALQAQADEAAELMAELGINGDADGGDPEGDPDGDSDESDPAEVNPPDPTGDPDADPAPAEDEPADTPVEQIAAALNTSGVGAVFQRARTRRAAANTTTVPAAANPSVLVATAGPAHVLPVPNTMDDVGQVFSEASPRVTRERQTLVTLRQQYPVSRQLTSDATVNSQRLDAVMAPRTPEALVAAGGICAPTPAVFDHPICGDRSRPIRDALPDFNAARGGVRFAPTATVDDLTPAVGVWTYETDVAPSDQVKPCPRVDCEPEDEVFVDAITACLKVGVFQQRFNPEFWASRLALLDVAHDRIAEVTHFDTMVSLATAVDGAAVDGNTVTTVFLSLARAMAGIRSRHRLDGTQFQAIFPAWVQDALAASVVRQAGRAGGPIDDLLAVARARINGWFTAQGVTPIWSPDIQLFGAQAAGALNDWPSDEATWLLYPQGTFFFLDGGVIDLGTEVLDEGLVRANDRMAFKETFEQVAFRGCEALAITTPIGEDCVCDGV